MLALAEKKKNLKKKDNYNNNNDNKKKKKIPTSFIHFLMYLLKIEGV